MYIVFYLFLNLEYFILEVETYMLYSFFLISSLCCLVNNKFYVKRYDLRYIILGYNTKYNAK